MNTKKTQIFDGHRMAIRVSLELGLGILLLIVGIGIYLLFRSTSIRLYQWCMALPIADTIETWRNAAAGLSLPDFCKYSLPDGLYCASYILMSDAVWRRAKVWKRTLVVSIMPLVAISHELLQITGIAHGTFDLNDLFCYAVPLLSYYAISFWTDCMNRNESVPLMNFNY